MHVWSQPTAKRHLRPISISPHLLSRNCLQQRTPNLAPFMQTQNISLLAHTLQLSAVRLRLKCDGTRSETRCRLSAKRTSPFKSAGASVQSTTGSRGVRISGSNAGYTMFRGSVKNTSFASFPFTSPPVRHCVPSHFNSTLPPLQRVKI